jgi:hypothetical protein
VRPEQADSPYFVDDMLFRVGRGRLRPDFG